MACLDKCEITVNCNSINFDGTSCTLHKTIIVTSALALGTNPITENYERANCADCSNVLVPNMALPSETIIPYDVNGVGQNIGSGYSQFIADQTTIGCEDISCMLGTAGDCGTPYIGDKVWIDPSTG